MDLARLKGQDVAPGEGALWLRNTLGHRTIKLALHPVQILTLVPYLRLVVERVPGGEVALSQMDQPLFPSITTNNGRRVFTKWLKAMLASAGAQMGLDPNDNNIVRPCFNALLAGARRWLLEIYPVYLVSVLAGRFRVVAIPNSDQALRKRRRGKGEEPWASLRRELRRFLATDTGIFGRHNVEDLYEQWRLIVPRPAEDLQDCKDGGVGRNWNTFLFIESMTNRLREGRTNRYNTLSRWFETGRVLVDLIGDTPAWSLTDEDCKAIASELTPLAAREMLPLLKEMILVAVNKSLCVASIQLSRLPRRSKSSHPRQPPTSDEIEKIAAFLRAQACRTTYRRNAALPGAVQVYLDLLALGLRKEEALFVTAKDIDIDDGSEYIDLVVNGHKTPAARRRVPLDQHPHRGSAERIIATARFFRENGIEDRPLLAIGKHRYRRHQYVSKVKAIRPLKHLDHALARAGRKCGLERLTPHDLRHSSVSNWLVSEGAMPELIAKYHGHVDMPVTFEHYVHGLSTIQKRSLERFLTRKENQVWISAGDAIAILGISKQAFYKRYSAASSNVRKCPGTGLVLHRKGRPLYIEATALVKHLPSCASRVKNYFFQS